MAEVAGHDRLGRSFEGVPTDENEVGGDAEGVDVRGGGRLHAPEALGSHVEQGPGERARWNHRRGHLMGSLRSGGGRATRVESRRIADVHPLGVALDRGLCVRRDRSLLSEGRAPLPYYSGQAEVEELHDPGPSLVAQEHVGGLQVAVKHAVQVGEVDRAADGGQDGQRLVEVQVALGSAMLHEGRALEVLHDEVGKAASTWIDPKIGDVDDSGVLQTTERLRFDPKLRDVGVVPSIHRADQLEGEDALQLDMAGEIDDAHSALAQASLEPVLSVDEKGTREAVHEIAAVASAALLGVFMTRGALWAFTHRACDPSDYMRLGERDEDKARSTRRS